MAAAAAAADDDDDDDAMTSPSCYYSPSTILHNNTVMSCHQFDHVTTDKIMILLCLCDVNVMGDERGGGQNRSSMETNMNVIYEATSNKLSEVISLSIDSLRKPT